MPPKKPTTNGDGGEGSGKFTWEGPNDTKLLLLTQGRYVKPDEYDQLSKAFSGTTLNWELPEGGAGHSAKKTNKKRGVDEMNGANEPKTPTKSPRKRKTKSEEVVKKDSEEEGEQEMEVAVKDELEDEF
ncbi:hypothetical protein K491DRAFT_719830 [Lophiostoma macrostomum CBS 122681]|uniref:Uncharacterized protein n=1 Tax=Lophiostoma macrostomum CBS 122681 TaxID=1314788 RepID=A0A6A6SUG6_9PLEO|nr:hypothetical protein K491DRAFT_719830 [Lophiostoma macrostomum CBS 122681]